LLAAAAVVLSVIGAGLVGSNPAHAHWLDGTSPNGCGSSQTVRTATLGYGPNDAYWMGFVQLRFSDPCDIVWTRVCAGGNGTYNARVSVHKATRGASYAPVGTYSNGSQAGSDTSSPICGSYSHTVAEWSFGVYTDCTEDYGTSCPTWGDGSMDAFYQGTYYYDAAQTSWF